MTAESRCADGKVFEPREDDRAKCERCGKLVAYHSTATRETVMLEALTADVAKLREGQTVLFERIAVVLAELRRSK